MLDAGYAIQRRSSGSGECRREGGTVEKRFRLCEMYFENALCKSQRFRCGRPLIDKGDEGLRREVEA
jgi:hypothetical protein